MKVVATISPQLFAMQAAEYRDEVCGLRDHLDAMVITNGGFNLMHHWADGPLVREYSLCADWDNRWRTGGSVTEVMSEAHLDPESILRGIRRFVDERAIRLDKGTSS